jgi:hypothetical protein
VCIFIALFFLPCFLALRTADREETNSFDKDIFNDTPPPVRFLERPSSPVKFFRKCEAAHKRFARAAPWSARVEFQPSQFQMTEFQ